MDVDTGAFQALTDQVAALVAEMRDVAKWNATVDLMYRVGRLDGEQAARDALLGKAAATTPTPAARKARAAHLRPVDGDAS